MRYKSYKYRIYPTKDQEVLIAKHIGCSRFIYNYGLNQKVKSYQETGRGLSRFEIQSHLPLMKKAEETSFLKEVNSQTLQSSLEDLDRSFTGFFRDKKGFPKFKSKRNPKQSFSIPQKTVVDFDNKYVFIPKFKQGIKTKFHRVFDGKTKGSTISRTPTGKYYISILVEIDGSYPELKPIDENKAVGLDIGIKTFAVLSDGLHIDNPRNLKKSIKKLKRKQRSLSRKVKGSNNREKARLSLSVEHERVSNRRSDFLNKTTRYLVDNYDTICLETLSAKNMIKNHKLAQALSDISIGAFNAMIEMKAKDVGTNILRIGRFEPSSKTCICGYINTELKLSHRSWTCIKCGITHDRDLLAANNIKRFAFSKNNTAGTAEIHASGDMKLVTGSAEEATCFSGW